MDKRIIVEGPDGSGKSTLIELLLKIFPNQLHLVEGFKHSKYDDYYEWFTDVVSSLSTETIPVHNRLFYSELVYGKVLRGKIDVPHVEEWKTAFRQDAFLIYCTLPYEELVRSATENPQMEGVMQNLRAIQNEYERIMGEELPRYWGAGRCVSYNYHRPGDLAETIDLIGMYLS